MALDFKKIKRIVPLAQTPFSEACRDRVVSYEVIYEPQLGRQESDLPTMCLYKYYTEVAVSDDDIHTLFEEVKMKQRPHIKRVLVDGYPPPSLIHYGPFRDPNIRQSVLNAMRIVIPFLKDPSAYCWKEIRKALMLNVSQTCLQDEREIPNGKRFSFFPFLFLLPFISSVLGAKWQVGLGSCSKDPDPENFYYPRTDPEVRAFEKWRQEVVYPTETNLAKELGLQEYASFGKYLEQDENSIQDEEAKNHEESVERLLKEEQILQDEMRKRGLSFELYYSRNRQLFPKKGEFKNLSQLLKHRFGVGIEKMCTEKVYYEAEKAMLEVWEDYYGSRALFNDFETQFVIYLYRHKVLLEEFSLRRIELDPGHIYQLFRSIESLLHEFIKEKLIESFGDGENNWWLNGVPANIRVRCQSTREQDMERFEAYTYCYLIELKEVILKNWSIFRPYFEDKQKEMVKKEKQVAWLDRLNSIRNLVMHPVRRSLTEEEKSFLLDCHRRVQKLKTKN
jgi:hypothetical protein